MSANKSRFWGNFWGETGRNTGKWASNKVFGSRGWSTPRMHLFDNQENKSIELQKELIEEQTEDYIILEKHKTLKNLNKQATEINYNSNEVDEIIQNLDQLLTSARQAQQNESSESIFTTKIRSGIMRLNRVGEFELASFYKKELKKIILAKLWKKITFALFVIVIFGGLLFFAFVYEN